MIEHTVHINAKYSEIELLAVELALHRTPKQTHIDTLKQTQPAKLSLFAPEQALPVHQRVLSVYLMLLSESGGLLTERSFRFFDVVSL